jgi:hypothetical protein
MTHITMIDGTEYEYDERGYEVHEDKLAPARGLMFAIGGEIIIALIALAVWVWL